MWSEASTSKKRCRHATLSSDFCSEKLYTRCHLPCICLFKQNYPQFVQLRAFGKLGTDLTFNLEEKSQGKVFGNKCGEKEQKTNEGIIAGNVLILKIRWPVYYILCYPFYWYT